MDIIEAVKQGKKVIHRNGQELLRQNQLRNAIPAYSFDSSEYAVRYSYGGKMICAACRFEHYDTEMSFMPNGRFDESQQKESEWDLIIQD